MEDYFSGDDDDYVYSDRDSLDGLENEEWVPPKGSSTKVLFFFFFDFSIFRFSFIPLKKFFWFSSIRTRMGIGFDCGCVFLLVSL